jgi:hypothetical protein
MVWTGQLLASGYMRRLSLQEVTDPLRVEGATMGTAFAEPVGQKLSLNEEDI